MENTPIVPPNIAPKMKPDMKILSPFYIGEIIILWTDKVVLNLA